MDYHTRRQHRLLLLALAFILALCLADGASLPSSVRASSPTPSGPYAFNNNGSGTYIGQAGVNATLTEAGRQWTLTTQSNQVRYLFNGTAGQFLSASDRNGNTTSLVYNRTGVLSSIADPGGRGLTFSYDSSNRITKVQDTSIVNNGQPRSVAFVYDGTSGDLTGVTDVMGGSTSFAYSQHWLTSITDQNNHAAVRNNYDQQGRVTSQEDADNNTATVAYASPSAGVTTFTDPNKHATQIYFDQKLRVTDVVDTNGNDTNAAYKTRTTPWPASRRRSGERRASRTTPTIT